MVPPGSLSRPFLWIAVASAILLAGLVAVYVATLDGIIDFHGYAVGRDFVNIWTASHLFWSGNVAAIFDPDRYIAAMRRLMGPEFRHHFWSYPPTFLFFALPFAALPYVPAWLAWIALTGAAFAAAVRTISRDHRLLALLLIAPSTMATVLFGQNGFLTAALLVGGAALMPRRPVLAGVLLGLLTFKPQLGLLVPVLMLAERNWTVLVSAAATAVLFALAAALAFGWAAWGHYVGTVLPFQTEYMATRIGTFAFSMPTWFMSGRLYGLPAGAAYVLQAVVSLAVIGLSYRLFRLPVARSLKLAILCAGTIVATPQAFNYDMSPFSLAILLSPPLLAGLVWRPYEQVTAILAWAVPWLVLVLGFATYFTGVPVAVAPLILTAFFGYLALHALDRARTDAVPPPPVRATDAEEGNS